MLHKCLVFASLLSIAGCVSSAEQASVATAADKAQQAPAAAAQCKNYEMRKHQLQRSSMKAGEGTLKYSGKMYEWINGSDNLGHTKAYCIHEKRSLNAKAIYINYVTSNITCESEYGRKVALENQTAHQKEISEFNTECGHHNLR